VSLSKPVLELLATDALLEILMKRICTIAAFLLATTTHAQVTLNSVRIGAKDTVAVAKFYQTAFGMQGGQSNRRSRRARDLRELRDDDRGRQVQ
jgi:hypothetical protein